MPEETQYEIHSQQRSVDVYFAMEPREHEAFHQGQQKIIEDLVDVFMVDTRTAMMRWCLYSSRTGVKQRMMMNAYVSQ